MAGKKHKCPDPAPVWLTTWGDLTTLLLTFFVLLISMASFNPVKFAQVLGYFQTTTGAGYNIPTPTEPESTEEFFIQIVRASSIRQQTPEGGYRPALAGENILVKSFKDNYVVRFTDRPFFERFRVTLTEEGKRRLETLAGKLKSNPNVIYVVGRLSADENEAQFQQQLQTLPLEDGTAVRVLAAPQEEFMTSDEGRPVLRSSSTVLIQTRTELAAKRAETVSEFLKAAGIDAARIREVSGDEKRGRAEELFEKRAGAGSFIFAYGGSDAGRTVEVIVTGEVIFEGR